jgi:hypothetical protein
MPVLPNSVLPGAGGGTGGFGAQVGSAVSSGLLGSVGLSAASTRQNVADMFKYSDKTNGPSPVLVYPNASNDWRVRISLAPGSNYFYNDKNNVLLQPLRTETGGGTSAIQGQVSNLFGSSGSKRVGVVFPYTPSVALTHTANYTPVELTHSNYKHYAYNYSEVAAITINGEFTVQNVNDGQYLLAAVYFFRSCTKMFFGADPMAGNPPPIVYLNGYGQYYLPNVPCVVTSFAHTMPADCDYMDIPEPAATNKGYNPQFQNYRLNSTRMPTTSQITVSLQPVYSRYATSQGFSLADFSAGALVNTSGAGMPASAFGATQQPGYANKGANAIKGGQNGGFL